MGSEVYHDEGWLRKQYWENELSVHEIGDNVGVTGSTIARWLRKHEIERRSTTGTRKDKQYKNESWLRAQFENEARSVRAVAAEVDVAESTIRHWADKYDIERPDPDTTPEPLQDEEWLRKQYIERKRPTTEIADEVGCTDVTVSKWLREYGINVRSSSEAAVLSHLNDIPSPRTNEYGYQIYQTQHKGERFQVAVHRLLAVADYGFDAVTGKVVHHENHIPWDNRHENLSLMKLEAHSKYHSRENYGEAPWRNKEQLRDALKESSPSELVEQWGCHPQTLQNWIRKHDIDYSYDPHKDAPWRDEELLRKAYRDASRSELAERWGCATTTIDNWLSKYGIKSEDLVQTQQRELQDYD